MDAQFFASIGVDAVKHDNCNEIVPNTTEGIAHNFHKYERMSQALNKTGRPILYDVTLMVSKPRTIPSYDYNYIWSPEPYGKENVQKISNMWWSVPLNKYNCWKCCVHPNEFIVPDDSDCDNPNKKAAWRGLLPMLDIQDLGTPGWTGHWDWAGPNKGWNHLDQLSVCVGKSWYGPGLTPVEQQSQISLWAIMASPLIISVDTRNMEVGDFCHNLISNPKLIHVHQDKLGIPGKPIKNNYYYGNNNHTKILQSQIWTRPIIHWTGGDRSGAMAVVFFNRDESDLDITTTIDELGMLNSTATIVEATNVWTDEVSFWDVSIPLSVKVASHGVTFLTLMPRNGNFRSVNHKMMLKK